MDQVNKIRGWHLAERSERFASVPKVRYPAVAFC
jgi:hypothetical protein